MKLNPDCIRDLMLYFEEQTKLVSTGSLMFFGVVSANTIQQGSAFSDDLKQYSPEERVYHVIQLSDSGYIATNYRFDPEHNFTKLPIPSVYYVTPKEHEFIASIRKPESWAKTSSILKKLGTLSLSIIESVSKGITEAAINASIAKQLGI